MFDDPGRLMEATGKAEPAQARPVTLCICRRIQVNA